MKENLINNTIKKKKNNVITLKTNELELNIRICILFYVYLFFKHCAYKIIKKKLHLI